VERGVKIPPRSTGFADSNECPMKKAISIFALISVLCVCNALAQTSTSAPNPKMPEEDRAKALKWLDESYAQTIAAVEKLSDAQWSFKAAPEKWSVGECVEHILMAEGLLFSQMEKALAAPAPENWAEKTKGKTDFLERVMVKRQGKAQAPESIVPSGKMARAELMTKLKEARAQTRKFAVETKAELNSHTTDHIFQVFNTLSAYQWLVYIPLHNIRHNQQIEEVKAHANFPKQ
jgi:DinB superfamily